MVWQAPSFRERVYQIVRLVPHGQVTTYGYVALLAGASRSARQVGWALRTLPRPLVWAIGDEQRSHSDKVPWHRVVNAQGRVSRHPEEEGTRRQIALLRSEGIEVSDDGTLARGLEALGWWPDPGSVEPFLGPAPSRGAGRQE